MSNIVLAAGGGEEGYQISRSVRLRSSASAYFNRTNSNSPTSNKICTWSFWFKNSQQSANAWIAGTGTSGTSTTEDSLIILSSSQTLYCELSGTATGSFQTSQVFRDPSAWYHIIVAFDTTQATNTNRIKVYVNGVQVTAFASISYPSQNALLNFGGTQPQSIGRRQYSFGNYLDGYLTEVNFIDGQALTPSSFGETDTTTGVWKPKRYAGTYGTNGFYLNFSDNSAATAAAIGKDSSGNGNNWTPNNISVTSGVTYDSMLDVPTMGGAGSNHCVMNPLDKDTNLTLSDGNLTVTGYNAGGSASFGLTSGKWYWEVTLVNDYAANNWGLHGVSSGKPNSYISGYTGYPTGAGVWANTSGGSGGTWASGSLVSGSTTWANGDVLGLAFDATNLTLDVYRNNVKIGTTLTVPSGAIYPTAYQNGTSGDTSSSAYNFGQRPFAHTPPTGFKALNTQNLPDATIKKGNAYFDVSTWTGDSASTRNITNSGSFQPDFVWLKNRTAAYTSSNALYDSVRGAGSAYLLVSNNTNAEGTANAGNLYGYLSAFNSNGFTAAKGTTDAGYLNQSPDTYVAWQWKESASAGFDIVTYTGTGSARTINHNLGVTPSMFLVKRRNAAGSWRVFHNKASATPQNGCMFLEGTQAFTTTTIFNNTAPTSTTFAVGTDPDVNASGATYVAYLFSEVAGYSKFGSYTGNDSNDGPFVYCGFRPRFVMIKNTTNSGSWVMLDTARDTYNAEQNYIFANQSTAENGLGSVIPQLDGLSNGFKIRANNANSWMGNQSGSTFIYAAFAENPFKHSLAR